jgi:hypothetical protein
MSPYLPSWVAIEKEMDVRFSSVAVTLWADHCVGIVSMKEAKSSVHGE